MISCFKGRGLAFLALAGLSVARAGTLFITPVFGSSITSSGNSAAIEGSINTAISTLEGLYATPTASSLTITINYTYTAAGAGNLLSTDQDYYSASYSAYKTALTADSVANPTNTVLATAIANLPAGNDASGADPIVMSGALYAALGLTPSEAPGDTDNVTININSIQNFAFTQSSVGSGQFDLIGGLEHEMDEVLGGGGGGSNLNALADGACNPGSMLAFFCGQYGPLDLYRYGAPGVPSFSDVNFGTSISYLSVDGGVTNIVAFNQNTGGDLGDFYPNCGNGGGTGELIQNAFNCSGGPDEAYTTSSPEFAMEESIGWDSGVSATPEPGTLGLFGASLVSLVFLRRRFSRK